jgi:hypothetical protein
MGKRSGTGGGNNAAAGVPAAGSVALGTVTVSGKETALSGTVKTVWNTKDRAQFEIDVSAKGFLSGRAFGSVVFNVDKKAGTARIVSINSVQALKGQRVGERMYAAAFAVAKSQGVTKFTSDVRVSLPAAAAWRRLNKKLGNVTEGKSTSDGQQLTGKDNKPVFSIDLSKVSKRKLDKLQK